MYSNTPPTPLKRGAGREQVALAAENGQRLTAVGGSALGGSGCAVVIDQRHSVSECGQLGLQLGKLLACLQKFHGM